MRHGTYPLQWLVRTWLDGSATDTAGGANCFREAFQIKDLADEVAVLSL